MCAVCTRLPACSCFAPKEIKCYNIQKENKNETGARGEAHQTYTDIGPNQVQTDYSYSYFEPRLYFGDVRVKLLYLYVFSFRQLSASFLFLAAQSISFLSFTEKLYFPLCLLVIRQCILCDSQAGDNPFPPTDVFTYSCMEPLCSPGRQHAFRSGGPIFAQRTPHDQH